MIEYNAGTDKAIRIIEAGAESSKNRLDIIYYELMAWLKSEPRKEMLDGWSYYGGRQEILNKKREMIGENGQKVTISALPNSRITDNQYRKAVIQKTNYLFGQPITFETENDTYYALLQGIFNKRFQRTIKNVGTDIYNGGISWIFPYIDNGQLKFKKLPSYNVLPFRSHDEHTQDDRAAVYEPVIVYEGRKKKTVKKVTVLDREGVKYYVMQGGMLIPDIEREDEPYLMIGGEAFAWDRIPLVAFKRDAQETPLIRGVKSIQDAINTIISNFEDNMLEDMRNTILVLVNYAGENLGEFRRNLASSGCVKVETVEGVTGDIKTLKIEVNAENYKAILETLKKAIIENTMSYDAKDDRIGSNANQLNIMSMYNDIDLDANNTETEAQAAFEELIEFVNTFLRITGRGDFDNENVKVIFNRDMLINESGIMQTLASLGLQLSQETLINQVPYITDAKQEMQRIKAEAEEQKNAADTYSRAFGGSASARNKGVSDE